MKQKNFLTSVTVLLVVFNMNAQVGIGTDKPDTNTALDVNGKVKIRDLPQNQNQGGKHQLIVVDSVGNLKRSNGIKELYNHTEYNLILQVALKNSLTCKELNCYSTDSKVVPFDNIVSPDKNLYDINNHEFIVPSNGLYLIRAALGITYQVVDNTGNISNNNFSLAFSIGVNKMNYLFFTFLDVHGVRNRLQNLYRDVTLPLKRNDRVRIMFSGFDTGGLLFLKDFQATNKWGYSFIEVYKLL